MESERDMPECEKYNENVGNVDDEPEEKKYLVQEMMGEQYYKYFWDEKHAL